MVLKFINSKRIVGKPNFSDHFKKIIKRYIKFAISREGSKYDLMHPLTDLYTICQNEA